LTEQQLAENCDLRLTKMNLPDFCIMTKKEYALLGAKAACCLTAAILCYLDYLLFWNNPSQNETLAEGMPINCHSSSFGHTISFPDQLSQWPWLFILVYNYFFCCK